MGGLSSHAQFPLYLINERARQSHRDPPSSGKLLASLPVEAQASRCNYQVLAQSLASYASVFSIDSLKTRTTAFGSTFCLSWDSIQMVQQYYDSCTYCQVPFCLATQLLLRVAELAGTRASCGQILFVSLCC